ncbi:hypothetical protein V6C27_09940 [Peptococcaceae bacterium 1198_IL3148]
MTMFDILKDELDNRQYQNVLKLAAKFGYYMESDEQKEEPLMKLSCPNCENIKRILAHYGCNIECQ